MARNRRIKNIDWFYISFTIIKWKNSSNLHISKSQSVWGLVTLRRDDGRFFSTNKMNQNKSKYLVVEKMTFDLVFMCFAPRKKHFISNEQISLFFEPNWIFQHLNHFSNFLLFQPLLSESDKLLIIQLLVLHSGIFLRRIFLDLDTKNECIDL